MYKCPICNKYLSPCDDDTGYSCTNCGIKYTWDQIRNFDRNVDNNEASKSFIQRFEVKNAILLKCHCDGLDVIIPDGIVEIGVGAFQNRTVKSVVIPNSVTKIGKDAFKNCQILHTIYFGTGIREIEKCAFENCFSLKEVHIKSIDSWCKINFQRTGLVEGPSSPLAAAAARLYLNDEEVKHLVLPDDVVLGFYQFALCSSIEKITFGYNVKVIANSFPFEYCNVKEIFFEGKPIDLEILGISKSCKIIEPEFPVEQNIQHPDYSIYANEALSIINNRKKKGVCQHCGGSFSFFTKICKFCKKKKDY